MLALAAHAMDFGLERHEATLPLARDRGAELLQKRFELPERGELDPIDALAAAQLVAYEARFAEHAEVTADRRPRHRERARDLAGRHGAVPHHPQDLPANRVGDGLSDGIHA